jgi:phage shock protein A
LELLMAKDARIRQLEQQLEAENEARAAAEGQVEQLQAQLAELEGRVRDSADVNQQLQQQLLQEQEFHQESMVSRGVLGYWCSNFLLSSAMDFASRVSLGCAKARFVQCANELAMTTTTLVMQLIS